MTPKKTHKKISPNRIKTFQDDVLTFYHAQGRRLPWRQTTDPYKILVSEIMLQQTQVSRVIPYYRQWVKNWPTVQRLAAAPRTDVLRAWLGLGYNSRAIRLHQAAHIITTDFHGDVLAAMKDYHHVPGVGLYTAQAVRIFSRNEDQVTVDTNIRRIFLAYFHLPASTADKEIWGLAWQCLPQGKSRDWHNALMDYGALKLTARTTKIAPKNRQPPYIGSPRQLRAAVLRLLLEAPQTYDELQNQLGPAPALSEVLARMCHERILILENDHYTVQSGED